MTFFVRQLDKPLTQEKSIPANGGDLAFRAGTGTEQPFGVPLPLTIRAGMAALGGCDGRIILQSPSGDDLVILHSDGRTEFGEKFVADEAAKAFWQGLHAWFDTSARAHPGLGLRVHQGPRTGVKAIGAADSMTPAYAAAVAQVVDDVIAYVQSDGKEDNVHRYGELERSVEELLSIASGEGP